MKNSVNEILEENKNPKKMRFSFLPLWLRIIGVVSSMLYILFIGFVFLEI